MVAIVQNGHHSDTKNITFVNICGFGVILYFLGHVETNSAIKKNYNVTLMHQNPIFMIC